MSLQRCDIVREEITSKFLELKKNSPEKFTRRIDLSWSNWGFGAEELEVSMKRLADNNVKFIELHGNLYGDDLGYKVDDVKKLLVKYDMKVSGVCGMFSRVNDLSSNRAIDRQRAIDYIKRVVPFTNAVGGSYLLVVPGAVGRPVAYDDMEFFRAVKTLQIVADIFTEYNVRGAIEPIRADEVSITHTVAQAVEFIEAVNHPGIQHINGDVYHMFSGESNMSTAVLEAGERMINLHLADTNRMALGDGAMDLDTLIMALYLIGFNREGCFATPEPLGAGSDPYIAMNKLTPPAVLDKLVGDSIAYFREREEHVLSLQ